MSYGYKLIYVRIPRFETWLVRINDIIFWKMLKHGIAYNSIEYFTKNRK